MSTRNFHIGERVALVVLGLVLGLLVQKYVPFSWSLPASLSHLLEGTSTPDTTTSLDYFQTDIDKTVSLKAPEDVARLRRKLIEFLWARPDLPRRLPDDTARDFKDPRYADILSLERIDRLRVLMEFGLQSDVYHFIPKSPCHAAVLYHEGHDGDFINGKQAIARFLDQGYGVVAFSMPLLGMNSQPVLSFPRLGRLRLTHHDQMRLLTPPLGHPVKYFIEPVIVTLNYLAAYCPYPSVSMVGISGGGWATVLAAAVDSRIQVSFPVAGSYPLFLRNDSPEEWGDFEQNVPELYRTANYLELYLIGSCGRERKQVQIFNEYDPSCFAGNKSEIYAVDLAARLRQLGPGEFRIFLDRSHRRHAISKQAMELILKELPRSKQPLSQGKKRPRACAFS